METLVVGTICAANVCLDASTAGQCVPSELQSCRFCPSPRSQEAAQFLCSNDMDLHGLQGQFSSRLTAKDTADERWQHALPHSVAALPFKCNRLHGRSLCIIAAKRALPNIRCANDTQRRACKLQHCGRGGASATDGGGHRAAGGGRLPARREGVVLHRRRADQVMAQRRGRRVACAAGLWDSQVHHHHSNITQQRRSGRRAGQDERPAFITGSNTAPTRPVPSLNMATILPTPDAWRDHAHAQQGSAAVPATRCAFSST